MSFDYDEIAETAAELLEEFGADTTLRALGAATYTPAGGAVTTPTAVDTVRKGVLLDFGNLQESGPGGLILQGDKRLLLEVGTEPTLKHRVLAADGITYSIKGVKAVNPAGTVVLYDVHLER